MTTTTTSSLQRYSTASIAMHWLMVLAFVGLYTAANLIDTFPEGEEGAVGREWAMNTHFSLGLLVFGLVWLRLVLRLIGTTPAIAPPLPAWQDTLAKLAHLALYAMMALMPLAGWAALSAYNKPIPFFGLHLPALLAPNEKLGDSIMHIHELGATVGYFLIGGHALAALFHHHVVKDNTLRRMLLK